MDFLRRKGKFVYVVALSLIVVLLLSGYVPGLENVSSWVTPPVVLFLGLAFALCCGQPCPTFNKRASKLLLQYSVVGLGFGMNLQASLASGKEGMLFTVISVVATMVIGMFIGTRVFRINRDTAYLISSGTAICGGSAIAAVGPVMKSRDSDMSVSLATLYGARRTAVRYLGCNCHSRYKFGGRCWSCLWRGGAQGGRYNQAHACIVDYPIGIGHLLYIQEQRKEGLRSLFYSLVYSGNACQYLLARHCTAGG